MSKFLPTGGFKWIDPKEFVSNKYSSSSLKGCVLEIYFEYSKELRELLNDCPLVSDKIEMKIEMLSNYQITIADFYDIFIGDVKILVPNLYR